MARTRSSGRPARKIILYFLLSLLGFVLAVYGCDTGSRILIAHQDIASALRESFLTLTHQAGTIFLAIPYVLLGGLALSLSRWLPQRKVFLFSAAVWILLTGLYGLGFVDAQQALAAKAWTAAALSVGLLPFLSIPVLLVAAVAALVLRYKLPILPGR